MNKSTSFINLKNKVQLYIGLVILIAGGFYLTSQLIESNANKKDTKFFISESEESELESENNSIAFNFDVDVQNVYSNVNSTPFNKIIYQSYSSRYIDFIQYRIAIFIKICNFRL